MKNKYPIKWVDQWGCTNTMTQECATKVLEELYNEWPCGLFEIEASIAGHKRIIDRMEKALKFIAFTKEAIDHIKYGN